MPAEKQDPRKNFLERRIPSAVFFDVDAISDRSVDLPHMLPSNEQFADAVGRGLGISERDAIVVYDTKGIFSAPRVWWTFRLFGAENVAVLDGGMPAWLADKLAVESGEPRQPVKPALFRAKLDTWVSAPRCRCRCACDAASFCTLLYASLFRFQPQGARQNAGAGPRQHHQPCVAGIAPLLPS